MMINEQEDEELAYIYVVFTVCLFTYHTTDTQQLTCGTLPEISSWTLFFIMDCSRS